MSDSLMINVPAELAEDAAALLKSLLKKRTLQRARSAARELLREVGIEQTSLPKYQRRWQKVIGELANLAEQRGLAGEFTAGPYDLHRSIGITFEEMMGAGGDSQPFVACGAGHWVGLVGMRCIRAAVYEFRIDDRRLAE